MLTVLPECAVGEQRNRGTKGPDARQTANPPGSGVFTNPLLALQVSWLGKFRSRMGQHRWGGTEREAAALGSKGRGAGEGKGQEEDPKQSGQRLPEQATYFSSTGHERITVHSGVHAADRLPVAKEVDGCFGFDCQPTFLH